MNGDEIVFGFDVIITDITYFLTQFILQSCDLSGSRYNMNIQRFALKDD